MNDYERFSMRVSDAVLQADNTGGSTEAALRAQVRELTDALTALVLFTNPGKRNAAALNAAHRALAKVKESDL